MVRNRPKVRKKFVVIRPKNHRKKAAGCPIEQPAAYLFTVVFPFGLRAEVERHHHGDNRHHCVRLQAAPQELQKLQQPQG